METKLVDSHCHLDGINLESFGNDLKNVILSAKQHDVFKMLTVGTTLESFPSILNIAKQYLEVSCSVGLHPSEIVSKEPVEDDILVLARNEEVVALGETGLDYHYDFVSKTVQQERFRKHIRVAKLVKKPLIIHMREATNDIFKILKEEKGEEVGGVMHCFTDTWETAKKALDMNFYISFSGILTFQKAMMVQSVAKEVPFERLLIETDSPYLAPVPKRGKPNEPAFVQYIAKFLAELRQVTYEKIAEITTENYIALFKDPFLH